MIGTVKYIHPSGSCLSGLMVIGEAPGAEEDLLGRPFVGQSGKLLDRLLEYIGLDREIVYVTNIVKIRPTEDGQNRTPTPEELDSWMPLLLKEIAEIRPRVITSLGNSASQKLLGLTDGITKFRGQVFPLSVNGYDYEIPVVPSYHPSFLLRKRGNVEINQQVKDDLKLIKSLL